MSVEMFKRQMKWRKERDEKVRVMRKQVAAERGYETSSHAVSAAEHVDSFWEYRRLVGDSDGGELLSEEQYTALKQLAVVASRNRLFPVWRCLTTGMDCYTVGPESRCFCGHSYKSHAWYNTESKNVYCRVPGCRCSGFNYVTGHGKWWIKCRCKHDHTDHVHQGELGGCRVEGCPCGSFSSPFSCACQRPWDEHATVIETKAERQAAGKHVQNLCGGSASIEAAGGALTRLSDLIPGADRVEEPLPFTDAGYYATDPAEFQNALEAPSSRNDTHTRKQQAVVVTETQAGSSVSLKFAGAGLANVPPAASASSKGPPAASASSKGPEERRRASQAGVTAETYDPRSDVARGLLSLRPPEHTESGKPPSGKAAGRGQGSRPVAAGGASSRAGSSRASARGRSSSRASSREPEGYAGTLGSQDEPTGVGEAPELHLKLLRRRTPTASGEGGYAASPGVPQELQASPPKELQQRVPQVAPKPKGPINYNALLLKEIARMELELQGDGLNSSAKYGLKKKVGLLKAAEKKENLTRERYEALLR